MSRRRAQPKWVESSRFASRCLRCARPTVVGERVLWTPGEGVTCETCADSIKRERERDRRVAVQALTDGHLSARAVYEGSDGAVTRKFLSLLRSRGAAGDLAALLFAAQKSSRRAKRYGATPYRGLAYDRKGDCLRSAMMIAPAGCTSSGLHATRGGVRGRQASGATDSTK
jgi:hypothetical protein